MYIHLLSIQVAIPTFRDPGASAEVLEDMLAHASMEEERLSNMLALEKMEEERLSGMLSSVTAQEDARGAAADRKWGGAADQYSDVYEPW